MIRNILCMVAEGVIRDAETDKISLMNLLENITAQGFPLFMQRLGFLAIWERAATDPNSMYADFLIFLDDEQLHHQRITLSFQSALRHRTIVAIQGFVIPRPGLVSFKVRFESGMEFGYSFNAQAVETAISQQ